LFYGGYSGLVEFPNSNCFIWHSQWLLLWAAKYFAQAIMTIAAAQPLPPPLPLLCSGGAAKKLLYLVIAEKF